MNPEIVNALQAAELMGVALLLIPLLITGIRDLLESARHLRGVWSLLMFLERWKDK